MEKIFYLLICFTLLLSIAFPCYHNDVVYADDKEMEDEEIYGNLNFDLENKEQLAANRVPGELLIKFKAPADVPGKEKQLQKEIDKVNKIDFIEDLGVYRVKVEDLEKDPNAVLNRLKNNRFIEYVEPNYIMDYSLPSPFGSIE